MKPNNFFLVPATLLALLASLLFVTGAANITLDAFPISALYSGTITAAGGLAAVFLVGLAGWFSPAF